MTNQKNALRPFGIRDKISYSCGDLANDCTFILSSTFLMKYYTNVMGVPAYIIGIMMMVARVVDAFTDVGMGRILDLSKPGKNGKFRPWILRICGPLAVMSFLLYPTWFQGMSLSFKVVWMFATYLLWGSVFYTMVNIPYSSMASAITQDPDERTQLSLFRNAGAMVANLVITALIPLIVYQVNEAGSQVLVGSTFSVVAGCFSVAAILFYLICYFGSTERVRIEPAKKEPGARQSNFVMNMLSNKALLAIIVAAIFLLLAQLTIGSMAQYIFPDYFGNIKAQSVAAMLGSVGILVMAPVCAPLAKRFGKKEISIIGMLVGAAAYLVCFLVRPDNVWVFVAFYVVAYMGLGVLSNLIWACIIDVIDYGEIKNGVREDGTTYACYSFARKLGQALSSGLSGALITMVGYTAATAADPTVLSGIFNITCLVPMIGFFLVAATLFFFYPLDRKAVEANSLQLKEKYSKQG